MLSTIPKITTYNQIHHSGLNLQQQKQNNGFSLTCANKSATDTISFKGWSPDAHNAKDIYKIVKLIKKKSVNRIALFSHYGPDGDSIGSILALKRMIEKATGKKVDALVLDSLHASFKNFDPTNEITVLSDIFAQKIEKEKISVQDITAQEVKEKFGDYDLAIVLDTPEKITVDSQFAALIDSAKHKVKIDHHAAPKGISSNIANYGEVNLVDSGKESATLLVMQFARPLGLKLKAITKEIAEALALGVVTDTAQYEFTKRRPKIAQFPLIRRTLGSKAQEIVTKLASTLGFKEKRIPSVHEEIALIEQIPGIDLKTVTQNAFMLTSDEFETSRQIQIQFSPNREIGYFSVDSSQLPDATKFVTRPLFQKLIRVDNLKYMFAASRIVKNGEDINLVVIESKDKSIKQIVDKFKGVGHHSYGAIELRDMSLEDAEKLIMEEIEQLRSAE